MNTVVYGSSIKGNGHFIHGGKCQDSNSFDEKDFSEDEIKVIALSDGHGGAPYCRSAKGAKFAVDIAKSELYSFVSRIKDFLDEIDSAQKFINEILERDLCENKETVQKAEISNQPFDISLLKGQIETLQNSISVEFETIKKSILDSWNDAVYKDFIANPINVIDAKILNFNSITEEPSLRAYRGYGDIFENNINFLNSDLPLNIIKIIEKNPRQLYGATLLAIAQYKDHIFILQIGDGDITVIDEDDNVDYPIRKSNYMLGNETDSLCQNDAINRFNLIYFQRKVKIAMLNTDGITNALENESELKIFAKGIYDNVNEEPEKFRSSIKPFLRMFSNATQDDCTLCFIANKINDDAYDIIKNSPESDEENELESTYRPMLGDYELNCELFAISQNECDEKTISGVDFSNVGLLAIKESFLKEQYIDLVESKKELISLVSQHNLMFDIIAYGKRYLSEREKSLNEAQKEAYRNKINDILSQNSFRLIAYNVTEFTISEDTQLKTKIQNERYAIVLGENDKTVFFQDISEFLFDFIKNEFSTLVTFSDDLPITDTYLLGIKNYDITLIKEK